MEAGRIAPSCVLPVFPSAAKGGKAHGESRHAAQMDSGAADRGHGRAGGRILVADHVDAVVAGSRGRFDAAVPAAVQSTGKAAAQRRGGGDRPADIARRSAGNALGADSTPLAAECAAHVAPARAAGQPAGAAHPMECCARSARYPPRRHAGGAVLAHQRRRGAACRNARQRDSPPDRERQPMAACAAAFVLLFARPQASLPPAVACSARQIPCARHPCRP